MTRAIVIEDVRPELDSGRFPVKRIAGESFAVSADIFKHGHDMIRASLMYRRKGEGRWVESPMVHSENDRWNGKFMLAENSRYEYTIEAWTDRFSTLTERIQKWAEVGEDISADLGQIFPLVEAAERTAEGRDKLEIHTLLGNIRRARGNQDVVDLLSNAETRELVSRHSPRDNAERYKVLEVFADRERALFASWYEMFHRSQGRELGKSATFKDCEARLPEIERMGFDVIYLPPIHPIGRTNRKGRNNSLRAGPRDPGTPWAIGSEEGGHMSIHPDLGTMDDFLSFLNRAREMAIEIALDLALQCSPDHPYVRQHPEWFNHRRDGTIRYAENPPKRYEDIYPLFFENENWKELWDEVKRVVLFWIDKGVKIFRVDNPHTKPLAFWEWLIQEIQKVHPDTIFLSEAFTGPKMMRHLAKLGFTQSYTYFTWKNTKSELADFLNEFILSPCSEYYRGNFFTNTPDILSDYLQRGGRPVFKIRLVLASTLSSIYGIYNGYELCENKAKSAGSEEYLDSEKYEYKVWDWDRKGNIKEFIEKVNRIRRENPALQRTNNLRLLRSENDNIIFYGKWTPGRENIILVAVNLDPFRTQASTLYVPIGDLGIDAWRTYEVEDLISGETYRWTGEANYVRLDPSVEPAHILMLKS